jgi:hypothetical protein
MIILSTFIPAEITKKRGHFRLRRVGFFLLAIITGAIIAAMFYVISGKQIVEPLQLLNRSPKGAEFEAANTTAPIYLYFNQSIDQASAVIEVAPGPVRLTATKQPDRQTVLILTPNAPWTANQTVTITIKKNLVSPDKNFRLPADITFQLIIKPLPREIFDRPI